MQYTNVLSQGKQATFGVSNSDTLEQLYTKSAVECRLYGQIQAC